MAKATSKKNTKAKKSSSILTEASWNFLKTYIKHLKLANILCYSPSSFIFFLKVFLLMPNIFEALIWTPLV